MPDYFSFVKGLVDSEDISLNLSREVLQQNRQVQLIAKSLEKKIKSILEDLLETYFQFDDKMPFSKLMVRCAMKQGYQHEMPHRFQCLLDNMKELDS